MLRGSLVVALTFWLSCGAWPQENASHEASPHNGRLSGRVICEDTRSPARGALVVIAPVEPDSSKPGSHVGSGMAVARTNLDGSYLVQHLGAGQYTAFVFLPGYLSRFAAVLAAEQDPKKQKALLAENGTIALRGTGTATLDITLQRGGVISGRVLYSDGSPAGASRLVLERVGDYKPVASMTAGEQMSSEMSTTMFQPATMGTDDQGRYRLAGLQPGTYRVAVTVPLAGSDYGEDDPDGLNGLSLFGIIADPRAVRFFSGNTYHRVAAKTYEVHDGEEVRGVDFVLPIDGLHEVRGSVAAQDGQVATTGHLRLTDDSDPQLVFQVSIHKNGTFQFQQVPPGTYSLAVSGAREAARAGEAAAGSAGGESGTALGDAKVAVIVQDDDVDNLNVVLNAGNVAGGGQAPKPAQ